jgi:uncharacterized protein DUF2860
MISRNKLLVAVLFILLRVSMVVAEDAPDPYGFSGYVAMVTGQVTSTSNLFAVENETDAIYNHYGELDDPVNIGIFKVFGEISYTFQTETQVYVGVPYDIDKPSRYYNYEGRNLGVSQPFERYGRLDVSIYVSDEQVWENPYLTDQEREITTLRSKGFLVDCQDILESGLNFFFKNKTLYFENDEDDVPAMFYPELSREGQVNQAALGYDLFIDQSHLLVPKISFAVADMKGDSNSYTGYGAGVTYTWDKETIIFDINTEMEMNTYEQSDPIFTETRKDKIFKAALGVTLLDRLGADGVFVNLGLGYSNTDSTVGFYDATEMYSLCVVGYHF